MPQPVLGRPEHIGKLLAYADRYAEVGQVFLRQLVVLVNVCFPQLLELGGRDRVTDWEQGIHVGL